MAFVRTLRLRYPEPPHALSPENDMKPVPKRQRHLSARSLAEDGAQDARADDAADGKADDAGGAGGDTGATPREPQRRGLRSLEARAEMDVKEAIIAALVLEHGAPEDQLEHGFMLCRACDHQFDRSHHMNLDCAGITAHINTEQHARRCEVARGQSHLLKIWAGRSASDLPILL